MHIYADRKYEAMVRKWKLLSIHLSVNGLTLHLERKVYFWVQPTPHHFSFWSVLLSHVLPSSQATYTCFGHRHRVIIFSVILNFIFKWEFSSERLLCSMLLERSKGYIQCQGILKPRNLWVVLKYVFVMSLPFDPRAPTKCIAYKK